LYSSISSDEQGGPLVHLGTLFISSSVLTFSRLSGSPSAPAAAAKPAQRRHLQILSTSLARHEIT
jgi:hypothetical protein